MKAEVLAEVERKRAITKERQLKQAEKLRLEEMATRVSSVLLLSRSCSFTDSLGLFLSTIPR